LHVSNWRTALRLWPWLAAITSGLLCTGCFAPYNQSWLCWIALTPLITAIWFSRTNFRRRWLRDLLLGYLAGVVFVTATFSWLGALGTLYENFFLHSLSLLLALYFGIYFAAWSWIAGLLRPVEAAVSAAPGEITPKPNGMKCSNRPENRRANRRRPFLI
jgi:apolipoprotein N-acyltransferase